MRGLKGDTSPLRIHYITQGNASDEGDYIFVGVHLNKMVLTDEEIEESPY